MSAVERIQLGPDLVISRVLIGLWQIADEERKVGLVDPQEYASRMRKYIERGLTSFDMADHYGSAELIAGAAKEEFEDNAFQCFTKWVPKPGNLSKNEVREAVDRARKRLNTDTIDMMQYHAWNYADPSYLDQLLYLQELKEEGIIRYLGVTNFDAAHLRVICSSGIDVISNQVSYSLIDQRAAGDMTKVCQEFGVNLLAYGTIGGGFLTEKWLGHKDPNETKLASWSLMKYYRFIQEAGGWEKFQSLLEALHSISRKHGVSMANVATKYILQRPGVAGVILGSRLGNEAYLDENLKLFEFQLDEDDRDLISQTIAQFQPIPGDCGDEYRKPPYLTASGDLSHHIESLPSPFQVTMQGARAKIFSGTSWEKDYGYCRALKSGRHVLVSGTTASHGDRVIGNGDAAGQTIFILDKIEGALQSLGASLEDVVRTRIFVQPGADWQAVAAIHGLRMRNIQPANTLVEAGLIGEEYLVEIEVDALLPE